MQWIGALLVAISRTVDYRHHWQDVTVGAILGTGLAIFAYHQYYPPLWSDASDEPFAPRVGLDFAPTSGRDYPHTEGYADVDSSQNNLLSTDLDGRYNLSPGSSGGGGGPQLDSRLDISKGPNLV